MMDNRDDLLFVAELSSRYHRRRASFLETVGQLMTFITLMAGASAFVSLLGDPTTLAPKILTAIVAAIGTMQALFRVEGAAALHRIWLGRWLDMVREINTTPNASAEQIQKWSGVRFAIESECVSELRALQVDCYNRSVSALGLDAEPLHIRWYERLTRHIISWDRQYRSKPTRLHVRHAETIAAE